MSETLSGLYFVLQSKKIHIKIHYMYLLIKSSPHVNNAKISLQLNTYLNIINLHNIQNVPLYKLKICTWYSHVSKIIFLLNTQVTYTKILPSFLRQQFSYRHCSCLTKLLVHMLVHIYNNTLVAKTVSLTSYKQRRPYMATNTFHTKCVGG